MHLRSVDVHRRHAPRPERQQRERHLARARHRQHIAPPVADAESCCLGALVFLREAEVVQSLSVLWSNITS